MKAVLFDLDGTLIDTAPDMAAALNQILKEENFDPLPLSHIRPLVSKGGLALTQLAFSATKTDNEIEPLRLRFLDTYLKNICNYSKLFEGFDDVLQHFNANNIPWGIVTNKPGWLTDPLLKKMELPSVSAVTISGDTTAEKKPHPLPLTTAAAAIGITCEDCLYVGDDPRDIEAGNAANMTTVIAKYGYISDNADLSSWQADKMIDHPLQLLELLN